MDGAQSSNLDSMQLLISLNLIIRRPAVNKRTRNFHFIFIYRKIERRLHYMNDAFESFSLIPMPSNATFPNVS